MRSLTPKANSSANKKQTRPLLKQDNRKILETFKTDKNEEEAKEELDGPGFELSGDVAVYRERADSKLNGILRVQSTKLSKNDDGSFRSGSSRFLTMTELQKRADGMFGSVSRVSSTAEASAPVYLAGKQLIQPASVSKSSDPTPEGQRGTTHSSHESRRSRREQQRLLEKYLDQIQGIRATSGDHVTTVQILAEEGGIVGYVEGLKKKGIVKDSFQVPSISRGSRMYGDPSLKLSNDDSSVNPLQLPPPRLPTNPRLKHGADSGIDEPSEFSDAPGRNSVDDSNTPAGDTTEKFHQGDFDSQRVGTKMRPKLNRELSLPEGRINLLFEDPLDSLTRLSTDQSLASGRSFAPSLKQRTKQSPNRGTAMPWERYTVGNEGKPGEEVNALATVATGFRLSRVLENDSSGVDQGEGGKRPAEKKLGFNSQRTLPPSTSPLRRRRRSKTIGDMSTSNTTATRKISVPRSDISANDETASDVGSTISSIQGPKEYRKRLESLKSEIKLDADQFGRKVAAEVKQKTAELEEERRRAELELARQRKLEAGRLKQIAATGMIQQAFHIEKGRKKKLAKATKIIQSFIRGFLLRKKFKDVKKQATMLYGSFNKFYKQYWILMRKIQNFYGASESDINPNMKELKAYIIRRQEYEASIRRVIGHKKQVLRPPQLEMALNRLDKYPCSQEIQRAILQTHEPSEDASYEPYSCFLKISVKEALDACFFIYIPNNIGLKPSEVRISSWMAPIVDGIEVKKYLSNPEFIPEAAVPYEKCVEAVMQIMFEQDLKPIDDMFGAGALKKITEKRQRARNIVV